MGGSLAGGLQGQRAGELFGCPRVRTKQKIISQRHGESFGFGESPLAFVEGEEAGQAEVDGSGDVEDVGEAVSGGRRMDGAETLGDLVDIRPINGADFEDTEGKVLLKVAQHRGGFVLAETFRAIISKQAHLQPDGLPDFQKQKGGYGKRTRVRVHPGINAG